MTFYLSADSNLGFRFLQLNEYRKILIYITLEEGGKELFSCNLFCHLYFTCSREKGSLFTVFCEIGKNINVQDIFNCSFIVKWSFYFAFFLADPPFKPLSEA